VSVRAVQQQVAGRQSEALLGLVAHLHYERLVQAQQVQLHDHRPALFIAEGQGAGQQRVQRARGAPVQEIPVARQLLARLRSDVNISVARLHFKPPPSLCRQCRRIWIHTNVLLTTVRFGRCRAGAPAAPPGTTTCQGAKRPYS